MERLKQRKESFLVHRLYGAGDILVFLLQWFARFSRWTEQIDQALRIEGADFRRAIVPTVGNVVGVMPEIFQGQPESTIIRLDTHDLTHLCEELWFAVRRQSHDFVFVAVVGKPDELRQRRIKNPQRMRKINAFID